MDTKRDHSGIPRPIPPSSAFAALLTAAAELERRAALLRDLGPCCPRCVTDADLDDAAWMLRRAAAVA